MPPFPVEHSPQVAGLLARGYPARGILAAALIRLGSLGWIGLVERPGSRLGLTLKSPDKSSADALHSCELWLLSELRRWESQRALPPAWSGWRSALLSQALAEGALNFEQAARMRRWGVFAALPMFVSRSPKPVAARVLRKSLSAYPDPDGPLPQTRTAWDEALAYAAALGMAEGFLRRAREVNEFYARHYQGVVMTFCTPSWFAEAPGQERNRFAYLTAVLAPALASWRWADIEII